MIDASEDVRYERWRRSESGRFAFLAQEALVRKMISGWHRRGRKLLELYCGTGRFLEMFWQAGFDVTGQDRNAGFLAKARSRIKHNADFTEGHPEHLPYDDWAFDYVVCLTGLEFAESPRKMLAEMVRLASVGVLFAFPNAWSWHGLEQFCVRFRKRKKSFGFYNVISPWRVQGWLHELDKEGVVRWGSNLLGPSCTWKGQGRFNLMSLPVPLGAFSMVRLDLGPSLSGRDLPLGIRPSLTPMPPAG